MALEKDHRREPSQEADGPSVTDEELAEGAIGDRGARGRGNLRQIQAPREGPSGRDGEDPRGWPARKGPEGHLYEGERRQALTRG